MVIFNTEIRHIFYQYFCGHIFKIHVWHQLLAIAVYQPVRRKGAMLILSAQFKFDWMGADDNTGKQTLRELHDSTATFICIL